MCGICGFSGTRNRELLEKMGRSLAHRGPDEEGFYDDEWMSLCARRLSIVDLQKGGQPVANELRDVWAACNGEIYNAPELRLELEAKGHAFRSSHSDTELIPHLYEEYGEDFVLRLNGMFAIAVWDKRAKSLRLYRDRMGVKPLYYCLYNGQLIFGSEIKSILVWPEISRELDASALYQYFTFKNTCPPNTAYRQIRQILPGSMLKFEHGRSTERRYWRVDYSRVSNDSLDSAIERTRELLRDAVKIRMQADVTVGAFLSGGLDSSLVSALASASIGEKLKTFTLGHEIKAAKIHDKEADVTYAGRLAESLRTEHHVCVMTPADVTAELPKVLAAFDEPFSGPISTYFLSKYMARHVKTAVSGDGADELFGGYLPHVLAFPMRRMSDCIARGEDPFAEPEQLRPFETSRDYLQALYDSSKGDEVTIAGQMLLASDELKGAMLNQAVFGDLVKRRATFEKLKTVRQQGAASDPCNRALEQDMNLILPNQVLAYEDRLSMAHALEIRSPFMDYRLIEYVVSLPGSYKVRAGESKYLLKKAAEGILPDELIYRQKQGFVMPIHDWMQDELREYICDTLSPDALARNEYLDAPAVTFLLNKYYDSPERNVQLADIIWNLTSFVCWSATRQQ